MIERNSEFISVTDDVVGLTATVDELVDKHDAITGSMLRVAENTYYVQIKVSCEKEQAREVMPLLKDFGKQYVEVEDVKVTFEQIENYGKDNDDPTKKDWAIPDGTFDDKTQYRIYSL